mmetsp:Transcript_45177/g.101659  ORF Transcript_45177/g.101659 Transcript_45177/m.101659 type:complete len:249 (+) Transcript_45177:302-1048(+)
MCWTRKTLSARSGASGTSVAFIFLMRESAWLDWFSRSAASRIVATSFSTLLGGCSGTFPKSRSMTLIWVMFAIPPANSSRNPERTAEKASHAGTIGASWNAMPVRPVLFMASTRPANVSPRVDFGPMPASITLSISSLLLCEEMSRTSRNVSALHSMISSETSGESWPTSSRSCDILLLKLLLVAGSLSFSSCVCPILGAPPRSLRFIVSATPSNDFTTESAATGESSAGPKPKCPIGLWSAFRSARG